MRVLDASVRLKRLSGISTCRQQARGLGGDERNKGIGQERAPSALALNKGKGEQPLPWRKSNRKGPPAARSLCNEERRKAKAAC